MYGKLFTLFVAWASLSWGETNPFDAPATTNVSGSALADSITQKTVQSADQVVENTLNASRGREYKAADAANQGNKGSSAAIGTGSALMSTAIPMLASPIPSVVAAGAILMSQAAMEFAQAGADSESSGANNAQNQLLTNQVGGQTGQQSTADQIKAGMNNPDLDKLLGDRGINSEDFKNRMANGEFQSPESVRAAIGDKNTYSADDLSAANTLADNSLNDVFKEVHGSEALGEMASQSVGMNEKLEAGSPGSESFASAVGMQGSPNLSSSDLPATASTFIEGSLKVLGLKGNSKDALGAGGKDGAFDAKAILAKLIGKEAAELLGGKMPGFLKNALAKAGIIVPTSKLTIFQTAHRNFRGFGKWRRSYRVAMDTSSLR